MNPLKVAIILTHDFDFHGFSLYSGGGFPVWSFYNFNMTDLYACIHTCSQSVINIMLF